MSNNVYEITLAFKGIKCRIQVIPDEYDCYELSINSDKPLSVEYRTALRAYLHEEGYIDEAFKV